MTQNDQKKNICNYRRKGLNPDITTRNCLLAKMKIMTNKKDGLQTRKLQVDQGLSEFSITIRRTDPLISKFPGAASRFFRPLLTPVPLPGAPTPCWSSSPLATRRQTPLLTISSPAEVELPELAESQIPPNNPKPTRRDPLGSGKPVQGMQGAA